MKQLFQKNFLALKENQIFNFVYSQEKQDFVLDQKISKAVICPGSFDPIHQGHTEMIRLASQNFKDSSIYLEITISNADKKQKTWEDYYQRLESLLEYKFNVIFSNCSLFVDKLKFLDDSVFVLGNDTLIRIMDLKYYGEEQQKLDQVVKQFKDKNCRFETFPRFDKALEQMLTIDKILSINKLNKDLENDIRSIVKEHKDFRIDISSTQLRNQKKDQ